MSTAINESIPLSDEDVEAQLTSALASLEGRSAAELTDEDIAKHLFGDKVDPGAITSSPAQTEFSKTKLIKVTKSGSPRPIADGGTVCTYKCFALSRGLPVRPRELMIYNSCNSFVDQWLGVSTGALTYTAYSGSSSFVALNKTTIPGRPVNFLVVLFYKGDEGEKFAHVSPLTLLLCVNWCSDPTDVRPAHLVASL